MAKEILIDFFNCDTLVIDNLEALKKITKLIVEEINSKIVEETWHVFQPVGITYVAVIAKSHVTIHTWPEKKDAAVDIFSCEDSIPDNFIERIQYEFHAESHKKQIVIRYI